MRPAILLLALPAALADEPPASPIVELPKFVVTDTRDLPPPESWRYATIPGFEILSNASDKATQRLLEDFSLFKQALGIVWPVQDQSNVPVMLIVCGGGSRFDAFAGKASTAGRSQVSLFLKHGRRTAIVIDFETKVIDRLASGPYLESQRDFFGNVSHDVPAEDASRMSVDHTKQLHREYVRHLLSQSEPPLPAWFEEGLVQIIMAMKADRKRIDFGTVQDPNRTISALAALAMGAGGEGPALPTEDSDFNVALRQRALMPLDKFFAVPRDSPAARSSLGDNLWAKQAYAFVHMCLFGRYDARGRLHHDKTGPLPLQKPLAAFVVRAAKEPVSEAMFKECFSVGYKEMAGQLRGYVQMTAYRAQHYRIGGDGLPEPPEVALRDATESEIGRIKGETLLMVDRKDAARTELIAPYIRGERDPQLLAALGLYERVAGQEDRARKFLAAAVAGKTTRAEAYLELGRLRQADALAQPAGRDGTLSVAQVAGVVDLLRAARKQAPPLADLYELAAETWLHCGDAPQRENVLLLIEGAQLFPARLKLVYMTAVLCRDVGVLEAAYPLTEHGLVYATTAFDRARFESLKASLPLRTPEATTTPPK